MAVVLAHENASAPNTSGDPYNVVLAGAETCNGGGTLFIIVNGDFTYATPSGFVLDRSYVGTNGHYLFRKTPSVAGEASWSLNPSGSGSASWWVAEYTGLTSSPLDQVNGAGTTSNSATRATGNVTTTVADELLIAAFGGTNTGTSGTWSGYTNSFVEESDLCNTTGVRTSLAIATRIVSATGTYSSTGTISVSSNGSALIGTYKIDTSGGTPTTKSRIVTARQAVVRASRW